MSADPLDDVFTLEDQFYTQGFNSGFEDGVKAGRIEGRSLGMEKGFEKFFQGGRLAGQSVVLLNRLPQSHTASKNHPLPPPPSSLSLSSSSRDDSTEQPATSSCTLPPLQSNPRLEKNVRLLYALVEPETFSTENTDEAVRDFDDRFKRAQGKAKIIERMINQEHKSTGE